MTSSNKKLGPTTTDLNETEYTIAKNYKHTNDIIK